MVHPSLGYRATASHACAAWLAISDMHGRAFAGAAQIWGPAHPPPSWTSCSADEGRGWQSDDEQDDDDEEEEEEEGEEDGGSDGTAASGDEGTPGASQELATQADRDDDFGALPTAHALARMRGVHVRCMCGALAPCPHMQHLLPLTACLVTLIRRAIPDHLAAATPGLEHACLDGAREHDPEGAAGGGD